MENKILTIFEKYYRLRSFVRENYNEMNLNSTPEDTDDSAEALIVATCVAYLMRRK